MCYTLVKLSITYGMMHLLAVPLATIRPFTCPRTFVQIHMLSIHQVFQFRLHVPHLNFTIHRVYKHFMPPTNFVTRNANPMLASLLPSHFSRFLQNLLHSQTPSPPFLLPHTTPCIPSPYPPSFHHRPHLLHLCLLFFPLPLHCTVSCVI